MQFKLPAQNMVFLSSAKAVSDLLEKRGSVYSDRPAFPMPELMGWGWNLTFKRHDESWRIRRRILHHNLHIGANAKHAGLQTHTALVFAQQLLESPGQFVEHIRRSAAANIMRMTYGLDIALKDDPLVKVAEVAMDSLPLPGTYLVDLVPALKYVPWWFPGAGFKRDAMRWTEYPKALINMPFERVKRDMELGTAQHSVVADALSQGASEDWATIVKEAAAVMYLGGSDTTVSTLMTFSLGMIKHTDVQRKAQEELDRVVGTDRLPTFEDRESLPYIEAIIREAYRMLPVLPLGLPHAAEQDDEYEGMLIRKGTSVFANIWAILHDPVVYPDPELFRPERFLKDGRIDTNVPDPRTHHFGFGRRVCPGKHFADTTVYITIATILACFHISTAVENGVEVPPSGKVHHGLVSTPERFECTIEPRSSRVRSLILDALDSEY
ncbi:cytochrome P450 [Exidia glandulosa HHB12029]|uniref:Cytochrome P450 n=1 Tax=Exidia glandulosa HHB12029 TaxID=1314781 RepID=A0A165DUK0_EXIGL|nr:cytochrome P450 [Exidia glandulosa HHB12029]